MTYVDGYGLDVVLNQDCEDCGGLQDWDDAGASLGGYWIKSSMTVRDAGNDGCPCPSPLDCGSSPQRACATVVSSRYSAWRVTTLLGQGCFMR